MKPEEENTNQYDYPIVGDSLASTINNESDILNALNYGHYTSSSQYTLSYKKQLQSDFNKNEVSNLGVDYTKLFSDDKNLNKINSYWKSSNSIEDGNFYDAIFNEGNLHTAYDYAQSFTKGKLDYYSLYDLSLAYLNGVDREQRVYNAIMSGNFENFVDDNDSENIETMNKCKEFVNKWWGIKTDYDTKYYDGEKEMMPIRVSMDEMVEGYANKYAKSNLSQYGIVYINGKDIKYDSTVSPNNSSKESVWINNYFKEYDIKASNNIGYIFVPKRSKQMLPLLMAQLADTRSHDYTNFSTNENEINSIFADDEVKDIKGDDRSHPFYSLARNTFLAYPEFHFDGITNYYPGGDASAAGRTIIERVGEGALAGGAIGGTIGSTGGSAAGPVGTLTGMLAGEATGMGIGAPIGFATGLAESLVKGGGDSLPWWMSGALSFGNELYDKIKVIEDREALDSPAVQYKTTTGSTMSAIPQDRLEELVASGELTPSVAKDILKSQVNIIDNIKHIQFSNFNYKTYMEDRLGNMMPMTYEQKRILEKSLGKIKDNQFNLRVVSTNFGYDNNTTAYYEFDVPNKYLLQSSLGANYDIFKKTPGKEEDTKITYKYLSDSGIVDINRNLEDEDEIRTELANYDLEGVTKFRVPINIIDSPDQEFYNNPLIVDSNKLHALGDQNARMQLLKDTLFGDIAIVSDKSNGTYNGTIKQFKFDFDGGLNRKNPNIKDKFVEGVYNDYAEIQQLMEATKFYMPNEELVKLYISKYGDKWQEAIPPKVLENFVDGFVDVLNVLSKFTYSKDKQIHKKVEERDYLFYDDDFNRFLENLKGLINDDDLYEIIDSKIK